MNNDYKLFDKKHNCWLDRDSCIFSDGKIGLIEFREKTKSYENIRMLFADEKDIKIVQYTGVNDCKNNKIYHGDILKRTNVKTKQISNEKDFGVIVKDNDSNNLILKWFFYSDIYKKYTKIIEMPLQNAKYYSIYGSVFNKKAGKKYENIISAYI